MTKILITLQALFLLIKLFISLISKKIESVPSYYDEVFTYASEF
jgi:preprotein translocase subunit SecG